MATIRERPRAGGATAFCVRWRDPDQGGKQVSITFDDRREAERFVGILNGNQGHLGPTTQVWNAIHSTAPTLDQIIEAHIARRSVTPRARADYRRDAINHISPYLGRTPIDSLTVAQVENWINDLADTKLSDKTIANVHGLLSSAVKTAVRDGHRADNPCEGLKLPRRDHSAEMVFLTPAQWPTPDAPLATPCDGYFRLLFSTVAYTGMRWGEACALQVGDLAFASTPPTIRISRALRRDEKNRSYVGPTKTRRSQRTISIPAALATQLKEHVGRRPPTALVFESHTGTALHHSNIRLRAWLPAVKAAMHADHGDAALTVQPRIHDLRHSHASWLFSQGMDLLAVQRRLGHESITTTADRYGHLLPGQQLAATVALDALFGH
jgi:integrase